MSSPSSANWSLSQPDAFGLIKRQASVPLPLAHLAAIRGRASVSVTDSDQKPQ
jgi:hypothetical protein